MTTPPSHCRDPHDGAEYQMDCRYRLVLLSHCDSSRTPVTDCQRRDPPRPSPHPATTSSNILFQLFSPLAFLFSHRANHILRHDSVPRTLTPRWLLASPRLQGSIVSFGRDRQHANLLQAPNKAANLPLGCFIEIRPGTVNLHLSILCFVRISLQDPPRFCFGSDEKHMAAASSSGASAKRLLNSHPSDENLTCGMPKRMAGPEQLLTLLLKTLIPILLSTPWDEMLDVVSRVEWLVFSDC
ncbi:hypothetical protein CPAR01_09882 [Colletotrichum paranaense]|uniref:Uncharacterized protein n=1 Tax=Colletotrichum paranaense TaxID=1914294 RepID=A0ABQ9SCF2_9PEZI|nr:uncharacterized protein CPAR01_09882 [Colletotrichum paranaense]KAK1533174.1 hypothetical protein CPAR01_09882 [Colletotrichum paranaense]